MRSVLILLVAVVVWLGSALAYEIHIHEGNFRLNADVQAIGLSKLRADIYVRPPKLFEVKDVLLISPQGYRYRPSWTEALEAEGDIRASQILGPNYFESKRSYAKRYFFEGHQEQGKWQIQIKVGDSRGRVRRIHRYFELSGSPMLSGPKTTLATDLGSIRGDKPASGMLLSEFGVTQADQ